MTLRVNGVDANATSIAEIVADLGLANARDGLFADGTVSLPGLRFASDTNTGFRRTAADTVALVLGGADRVTFSPTALTVTGSGVTATQTTACSYEANSGTVQVRLTANASAGPELRGVSNHAMTLFTNNTARMVLTEFGVVRAATDNAQNLGSASFRWATVFAGTGTINTSDEREKVWRGPLDEAELRAAKRILGELGIYQWADSVSEKGEDARLHFGVRAQRAIAILGEEGLDWRRYAWACHDRWEAMTEPVMEEVAVERTRTVEIDGQAVEEVYEDTELRPTGEVRVVREAGDRYGIRPDQLAFWLIAAQAAIQSDLDARLARLEAGGQ